MEIVTGEFVRVMFGGVTWLTADRSLVVKPKMGCHTKWQSRFV